MIQATDHEVYPSALSDGRLAGWGIEQANETDPHPNNWSDDLPFDDRTTAWAISVPGETEWVKKVE